MSRSQRVPKSEEQAKPEYGLIFRLPLPIALCMFLGFLFGAIPIVACLGNLAGLVGIVFLFVYTKVGYRRVSMFGPMWLTLIEMNIFLVNIFWAIFGIVAIARMLLD